MAGIWSRFQSLIFGGAIGAAASEAIGPVLEPARQHAWQQNQNRILDPGTLAALVAQGAITLKTGQDLAARNGYNAEQFDGLVHQALEGPTVSEVLELWRRNATRPADEQITEAQVDHALAKAQIEEQFWPAIKELFSGRLSPQVIATAIQRGVMNAPFPLPYNAQVAEGNIKPFPVSPLDAQAEAIASGVDLERLRVETALVGLPMALDRAARATFRNILTRDDFLRAVLEGNARGEWADAELEVAREIPTAHDGIEARLRGWIDDVGMYAQTARHGMSEEDTDLLLKITGRPLSFHQSFIGARRGGQLEGDISQIPEYFLKALRESNIRPEWYALAWAQRFVYPPSFVLRPLTEAGDLTEAETEQILLFEGWEPSLAAKVATRWAETVKATPKDKQVASAQTKLITAIHKAYIGKVIDDNAASAALQGAGLPQESITGVLYYWEQERQLEGLG